MGGLPLRTPTHRRYGGPLPRRLPNAPHAHLRPAKMPFFPPGCPGGIYAGLARLSAGCPPDGGRLHTCYSPVRRSPAGGPKSSPAAARLACVKPAASVHPEPGSNSPLLVIYFIYIFYCLFVFPARMVGIFLTVASLRELSLPKVFFPCLFISQLGVSVPVGTRAVAASCLVAILSMFSVSAVCGAGFLFEHQPFQWRCSRLADAKLQPFLSVRKFFRDFFSTHNKINLQKVQYHRFK